MARPKALSLMGIKCGMTRVYNDNGICIPVTVVKLVENRVVKIKTLESDGYNAVQMTADFAKPSKLSKAEAGHFAKHEVSPGVDLWECRLNEAELAELSSGMTFGVQYFKVGDIIDVGGVTIGKGFAGVIKKYHFNSQDETHGNSLSTRAPGSIGQRQSPGRVFKGKRMASRMGGYYRTILSLDVIKIDEEKNVLMVRGAVPGFRNAPVFLRFAVKKELT